MKRFKKLIAGILSATLFFSNGLIVANAESVSVSVVNNPKIDVMLTQKETSLDLSNFENDIKKSLESKGIDTSNIRFITAVTKTVTSASDDVDFKKVVDSWTKVGMGKAFYVNSNGYLTLDLTTSSPAYPGFGGTSACNNSCTAAYNYQMCAPGWFGEAALASNEWSDQHISVLSDSSGYLNTGIAFNTTINEDGTVNGYFLNTCYHEGQFVLRRFDHYALNDYFSHGINASVWCGSGWANSTTNLNGNSSTWFGDTITRPVSTTIHDTKGGNQKTVTGVYSPNAGLQSNMESWQYTLGTLGASKASNIYWEIDYQSETGKISITAGTAKGLADIGSLVVYDDTYTSGGYGVWGNNCEQKASTVYKIYSASGVSESTLTFKEILTQPTWREDAKHIVVNVDDNIDDTLTGTDNIGEILSRTLADKIHFIQWGTNANKSVSQNFIARNDNNGLFTYNSNYNQAVEDTANYIKSLIQQKYDSNYVIAGENTDLEVSPANLKNNAVSSIYPNGRWLIKHDDTYFANSEGKIADTYQKNLSCSFNKSGKYEIYFDGQKVKDIYAHRKPVADFDIAINGSKLTLTSKSYDLDSNDNVGYGAGIASEKWYYKEATATNWTSGKLGTFTKNKIYVIRLDVTDKQGVTSSAIKYVGTGAPVANFNVSSTSVTTAEKLSVTDTSYDPQGNDITKYEWVLKKNGVTLKTYSSKELPDIDFNATGYKAGTYNLTLKVTNKVGTVSEAFTKTITVETAKYKNKYEHWAWGFKNEGNNSNKTAFLLQTTYGEETYGEEFTPDATYGLTVPNGFYLAPRFGTGQITGKWTTFNFGTKLTQPAYVMNFEYDYYPTDYTITYNLNGGTNNSNNPSTYNVLYGVTFTSPTKAGYDFLGWYDANGNKITGINEGCNATFSDTADLYSKLKTRTTGNISVTAKWKKHIYSITTNKTGSGAISNSGIVTYTNNTSVFIIPAEGYTTSSLKIDGVSVSPVTKYNFLNVEADHKVEATFTISQNRKMELMQKGYKWIDLKL